MPRLLPVLASFALCLAGPARAATVASVFGGRVPCVAQGGVQFCNGDVTTRVETFDGVPLDVAVTLPPASMDGPFPLIVDLHGWSVGKTGSPYVDWANAGYAVLSYTARGFHASCGTPDSRLPDATLSNPDVCAERGWIRLADMRFEAHDTQHLAGLLADEGLVIPTKIGVTGASYGGGQSMILAALRDRIALPEGGFTPWKSPGGLDMRIAAAAPLIPWTDLAYALTPTGRTLDYRVDNAYGRRGGVQKRSWNATLYNIGFATGWYAPADTDFASDITAWNTRVGQGEPYDGDSALQAILDEITTHHSSYYVDDTPEPAPLFIYNAWTDDLFPVDEAVRFWRKTHAKHPDAEIGLLFADDFGHPRASLGFGSAGVTQKVTAFFGRHLKDDGSAPPPNVEVFTQACNGATVEGPYTAADWDAVHPGEVRYASRRTQRFGSATASTTTEAALDPLIGPPCRTLPADDDPGAATYRLPAARGEGFVLLGAPTIIADLAVSSPAAQVVGRLWDVAPDGTQTLVTHGVYRPRTDNRGPQPFQLHPNGWRFAAGHVPKLELVGRSEPYVRASNGTFQVTVARLKLRLPVLERPGGAVAKPAAAVLPPDGAEPLGCDLTPRQTCATGDASVRVAVGKTAAKDGLRFAWTGGGAANLGDPTAGTDYALCLYDGAGQLAGSVVAPAGARCGRGPCWKPTSGGFRWRDRAAQGGLRELEITADGSSVTARLTGAGPHLGPPALPVSGEAGTVQLVAGNGSCWGSTLGAVATNDARRFVASTR